MLLNEKINFFCDNDIYLNNEIELDKDWFLGLLV